MFGLYENAFGALTWGNIAMFGVAGLLLYLGIVRKMEPILLVTIGFGALVVNLPMGGLMIYADGAPVAIHSVGNLIEAIGSGEIGLMNIIYSYGIETEIIPLLIFLGVGALTDFTPTIARPISFIFGAVAQLGVFIVFFLAYTTGWFSLNEAACVGIIGGSDGPPTVFLTAALAPHLIGPITLVAYSYMALVPVIQPPIIKLCTTKKERGIVMRPQIREVSHIEKIMFPIIIFLVAALLVPKSVPLIGMFMFGNLLRSTGVTDRLGSAAGGGFLDVLTFLLGLTVGCLMPAEVFFKWQTMAIIGLAVVAFTTSTAAGIFSAKFVNLFLKEKINPMIGAAGVSAIPMAARVVQKMGQAENPKNFLIMHAMGPNMAGAIGTSVVAGILLGILG
ncbi:sodium ion-translocating decarboxylase subunit beta [Chloroflexota bacterium]